MAASSESQRYAYTSAPAAHILTFPAMINQPDLAINIDLLLHNLFCGVIICTPDGRVIYANAEVARLIGLEITDLIGTLVTAPPWRFVHDDGRPLAGAEHPFAQVQATQQPLPDIALGLVCARDAEVAWVRLRTFPSLSADQVLQQIVLAFGRDATRLKRAEEALEASESRYRELVQNANSAIVRWACDGTVLFFNEYAQSFFGYSPEAIVGKNINLLVPAIESTGADLSRLISDIVATPDHFINVINENVCRDGRRVWMAWTNRPIRDEHSQVVAILAVGNDITERKRAEDALRANVLRLQQLNTASLLINASHSQTDLLRLSAEHARKLSGAQQARVSITSDVPPPPTSVSSAYAGQPQELASPTLTRLAEQVCHSNTAMRLNGTLLAVQFAQEAEDEPLPLRNWLAVPLVGRQGHNLGLIELFEKEAGEFSADDEALLVQLAQISTIALENQQLYTREQAVRAQAEEANRLKDEFLATVSHELRTPLTALLGYAQLLQRRPEDQDYVSRTIPKLIESARAQAALIEDLLDVSRITSGKLQIEPKLIEIVPVIRAALTTVQPTMDAKRLTLLVDLDPAVGPVMGDTNRLQQVVWNLLSNATKFTPAGGQIKVRLTTNETSAELSVSDNGQGIKASFLPYLFTPFRQADSSSQRAHSGLGLGLAIVRHLVELHGGTVTAISPGVGRGATFTVCLPLAITHALTVAGPEVADETSGSAEAHYPLSGLRILVVDDQPDILDLLDGMLSLDGATVQGCLNAHEALALTRAWQPDVLVSDIAMPGEDGYWLIKRIRSLKPEEGGAVPAIALTAYVGIEDRMRVLAAGFQQYVPKPVESAELRDVILSLVGDSTT